MTTEETLPKSTAFHEWMGQWRLNTLDRNGCMFVLRFVLSAFRSRRAEDPFWAVLKDFFATKDTNPKILLGHAIMVEGEKARVLLDRLSDAFAASEDRLFWNTVTEATQLYLVSPTVYNHVRSGQEG